MCLNKGKHICIFKDFGVNSLSSSLNRHNVPGNTKLTLHSISQAPSTSYHIFKMGKCSTSLAYFCLSLLSNDTGLI